MEKRIPYYMAYPMPSALDDERRERMDYEYMKSMYPMTAKRLLPYIEDENDRMEYEGSMMFDEYPDRLQMSLMSRRVYDRVTKDGMPEERNGKPMDEKWLRDLIDVMMYQEIYKRRSDHRRYRNKYYPGVNLSQSVIQRADPTTLVELDMKKDVKRIL